MTIRVAQCQMCSSYLGSEIMASYSCLYEVLESSSEAVARHAGIVTCISISIVEWN